MLWSTGELAKVHIATLHTEAERDRLISSAVRAARRREAVPRSRANWWRRLMGMPAPALGSHPVVNAT